MNDLAGWDAGRIGAAAARVLGILPPTPVVRSERLGALLKLENLQVTGAFKVRGALNALAVQIEANDRRPVVVASAGNHALGVAWAARRLGLEAHAVVPRLAPLTKVSGAIALGASVVTHGESFEQAEQHARGLAAKNGWRFLHPFDDPDVIAGQGTVGLELVPIAPEVLLVPVGGGGLAAGVGIALRGRGTRLVGVQVQGVDGMARAMAGLPELERVGETIADGLRVRVPGALTRSLCAQLLDDMVVVTEEEVRRAMLELVVHERIVAEGAGAAAVAALPKVRGGLTVAIVSGGNVDHARLSELLGGRASWKGRTAHDDGVDARHGLGVRLARLGYPADNGKLDAIVAELERIGDAKIEITDDDLRAIYAGHTLHWGP